MERERRNLGTVLVEGIMGLLARLPLRFHLACGKFAAWIMCDVMHYRRSVVMINLARSYPEMKYGELEELCRKTYRHLGEIFAEAVWFGGCKGEKGRRKLYDSHIVEIVNPEVINALYDTDCSTMLLMSHCGNWELIGGLQCYNHNPDEPFKWSHSEFAVVYKRLHSKLWDRVMRDNRCAPVSDRDFDGYKESADVLRFIVGNRRRKFLYLFNTDQYPYEGSATYNVGEFMHQDTLAMTGAVSLAHKLGMNVCYVRWRSLEGGRYTVEFVPLCSGGSGETPEHLMDMFYAELEKDLNAQPWNYLWTHKRWK